MDLFLVSNCCKAPIRFKADDHIQCTKCKNPCYIIELKKKAKIMDTIEVSSCCNAPIELKRIIIANEGFGNIFEEDRIICSKCKNYTNTLIIPKQWGDMLTNYISKCCNASLKINIKSEHTFLAVCSKCGKDCDIIEKETYKMNSLLVSDCCKADIIIKKFDFVRCSKCDNPCKIIELDAESILNPDIPLHTRPSWNEYFLSITKLIASRSTCLRRQIGCVIVKENRILTTGYNGMPSGFVHCIDRGGCMREKENIPSGERLDYCFACHAESNAICQAAKFGISICGATVYLTNLPCTTCSKLIIQCKIKKVIYIDDYPSALTLQLFKESKTELIKYEEVK